MELTPEHVDKIRQQQIANALKRLAAGKNTRRDDVLLAEVIAAADPDSDGTPSSETFVRTWDDLAKALGVSRKSLQNWRARPDLAVDLPASRADGRHEVAAWRLLMARKGLAGTEEISADPEERNWKKYRDQLECTRMERKIAREDGLLLVAVDLEVAFGQLLAGITAALNHLPGSAARLVTGLRDINEVQIKLEDEVSTILQSLGAARYLEECIPEVIGSIPLQDFPGLDPDALRELLIITTRQVLLEIGSRALPRDTSAPE